MLGPSTSQVLLDLLRVEVELLVHDELQPERVLVEEGDLGLVEAVQWGARPKGGERERGGGKVGSEHST